MDVNVFRLKNWLVLVSLIIITGCATNAERITDLQPNTIKKDNKVGVVWITPCSRNVGCKKSGGASNLGQFVPDGANGLLVYGIVMSAHEDLSNALDGVSADPIVESNFLTPIASALQNKGAVPVVSKPFVYRGELSKAGKHSVMKLRETLDELHPGKRSAYFAFGFDQPYELTAIADELDSTTLVVLDLQEYGVRRSFGPLGVPIGRPHGLSLVRVFVWDVATKSAIYSDFGIARADIGGNWRDDNWQQVFSATNSALELAIDRAIQPLVDTINAQ